MNYKFLLLPFCLFSFKVSCNLRENIKRLVGKAIAGPEYEEKNEKSMDEFKQYFELEDHSLSKSSRILLKKKRRVNKPYSAVKEKDLYKCECGWIGAKFNKKAHLQMHDPSRGDVICIACLIPTYFKSKSYMLQHYCKIHKK